MVGGVPVGGGAPVSIQSMLNTRTTDVDGCLAQIRALAAAGCEIARLAVPDMEAAEAFGAICAASPLPLVADIHFDYRLAIRAAENGAAKIRINPGNIGGEERVQAVVEVCGARSIPIRIGVNGGSLEPRLLEKYGHPTPEALVESAFGHIADVIVCVGYLYGASLAWAADQYPDVKFIAIDVTQGDIGTDSVPANCYCITFKEEQAGYLAGYAIAKDGKTKLGFLGGMAVPAVIRYGYGFVQGADAAAQELGTNIDINYFYGGQFYGDANITSRMEGWYSNGTQVVFACGGGIYTSAVEAALKNNGYVVGVDVDQNYIGVNGVADGSFAYNPFITSAMKGLTEAVNTALSDIEAGDWSEIAASNGNFGLEDGDYIGLPTDADSWNFETFTTDEYEALKEKIKSGEIVVDNSSDDSTKPTVSEFTTVNYIQ